MTKKIAFLFPGQGAQAVGMGKDVAEVSRITNQISVEESRINAAYLSIGKRFYEENAGEVMEAYIQDF